MESQSSDNHAGIVTICAANLSCLRWLKIRRKKMDPSMTETMTTAFSDLQDKLDPATSPQLLGMILPSVKTNKLHLDHHSTLDRFFVLSSPYATN